MITRKVRVSSWPHSQVLNQIVTGREYDNFFREKLLYLSKRVYTLNKLFYQQFSQSFENQAIIRFSINSPADHRSSLTEMQKEYVKTLQGIQSIQKKLLDDILMFKEDTEQMPDKKLAEENYKVIKNLQRMVEHSLDKSRKVINYYEY
jgi:hypothetical protein